MLSNPKKSKSSKKPKKPKKIKPFVFNIPKNLTYIGVDEVGISPGGSLILVAAETRRKTLTYSYEWGALNKAKDVLESIDHYLSEGKDPNHPSAPRFFTLDDFLKRGMTNFHWTEVPYNNDEMNRQEVEHFGIANILTSNGYDPQKTVLMVDAFHTNLSVSKYVILRYLKSLNFNINQKHIFMCSGGDRSVPIVNFADLLAFQIKLHYENKYQEFLPSLNDFPIEFAKVEYDKHKIDVNLDEDDRKTLKKILFLKQGVKKYEKYCEDGDIKRYQ
ncbi:hypothetical protein KY321_00695 [Candidatus Woesearchaeota archaeon]|nr:hypothetical protein [Candidatus Woesearchaeota archaeon]